MFRSAVRRGKQLEWPLISCLSTCSWWVSWGLLFSKSWKRTHPTPAVSLGALLKWYQAKWVNSIKHLIFLYLNYFRKFPSYGSSSNSSLVLLWFHMNYFESDESNMYGIHVYGSKEIIGFRRNSCTDMFFVIWWSHSICRHISLWHTLWQQDGRGSHLRSCSPVFLF